MTTPTKTHATFESLVAGREDEFPVLARAAASSKPAKSVRIEWTLDVWAPAGWKRDVWHNYTQITRFPYATPAPQGSSFVGGGDSHEEQLTQFLAAVEETLIWGIPSRFPNISLTTCGGYRHYLGRELNDNDILSLRPFREPFLWTHHWDYRTDVALDTPKYEWLAEFSLEVIPQAA